MPYTVMYLRPRPDDSFWSVLRGEPRAFLAALALWALVLLAAGPLDAWPLPGLA